MPDGIYVLKIYLFSFITFLLTEYFQPLFDIFKINRLGEVANKSSVFSGPAPRAYLPHFLVEFSLELQKSYFFLVARPLPTPLSS